MGNHSVIIAIMLGTSDTPSGSYIRQKREEKLLVLLLLHKESSRTSTDFSLAVVVANFSSKQTTLTSYSVFAVLSSQYIQSTDGVEESATSTSTVDDEGDQVQDNTRIIKQGHLRRSCRISPKDSPGCVLGLPERLD